MVVTPAVRERRSFLNAKVPPALRFGRSLEPCSLAPPIIGLGTGGGFTYVLRDMRGGPRRWPYPRIKSSNQPRRFPRSRRALDLLDIDRDKARILGVDISSLFQALQASLGGFYVNDINLFGRPGRLGSGGSRRGAPRHYHQHAQRRPDGPVAAC
jgi:hypothetical protein